MDYKEILSFTLNFIKIPYFYFAVVLFVMLMAKVIFKVEYSNCTTIIKRYFDNFIIITETNGKRRILYVPIFTYFIVPIFWALIVTNIKAIDKDISNMITVVFAILIGMLFNLLILLIDMQNKLVVSVANDGNKVNAIRKLAKETYYAIMFEILVSIFILIMSLSLLFLSSNTVFMSIVSFVQYLLVFIFLFNLFIVLKRIFIIIEQKMIKND
ncbi:hypothetical protein HNQ80_004847 [Anaerosolibacter carboniphilus]|uniref:Uncharacterized protein n=1 Tax=Anaerosolibacter carboniphilus TaxID=1417629 RepID=A0A841KZC6_9FIRM|nr:hypothetical protein [Anaerosolibacter carboniphilus]MBB6218673.1 hypothetical protein [Anaerosolibacter carboniphilus]